MTQKPIEGVSMVYSFDDANAHGRRNVQYFEMFGNRALYHDGWIASVRHGRLPWVTGLGSTATFDQDKWELYDLTQDFSQDDDLAAKHPEKLTALEDEFWVEAEKYQVLPLDDRLTERVNPALRPSLREGRTVFTYYDQARLPDSAAVAGNAEPLAHDHRVRRRSAGRRGRRTRRRRRRRGRVLRCS